jgi:hypothetical protein
MHHKKNMLSSAKRMCKSEGKVALLHAVKARGGWEL